MEFFQIKFVVTSVIKICSKMWELCMHPNYDNLYNPLTSKSGKFQPQTNIFPGNSNTFSIKPTAVWVKISEKSINFSGLRTSYLKLANRKKLILPLGKDFKTLKNIIIGTARSFTIFQSGYFQIKLPLILILQMKQ